MAKKKLVAYTKCDPDMLRDGYADVIITQPSRLPKYYEFCSDTNEIGKNDPNLWMIDINDESVSMYPIFKGTPNEFREALAECYRDEFDPDDECIPIDEGKYGIFNIWELFRDEEVTIDDDYMFVQGYIDWINETYIDCDSASAQAFVDLNTKEIIACGQMSVEFRF